MITLKAEKRNPNVKAKKLRREGYVTGILSGKEMKEPVALQFDGAEAAKFIKANKEGTQIYLDIEGEKVDALVKNIDYNPIEKQLMALDFQALVAGEKVSTTVAVKLEHTDMVQGIVEQEMEEIHYKADPANLLDTIVIDFNGYPADVRDIHVKDLPIPEGKHVTSSLLRMQLLFISVSMRQLRKRMRTLKLRQKHNIYSNDSGDCLVAIPCFCLHNSKNVISFVISLPHPAAIHFPIKEK